MNEIINWLNGPRNFEEGLALYLKYGTSPSLKRILSIKGETKQNMDTLVYELGKLSRNEDIPVRKVAIKPRQVNNPVPAPVADNKPALTQQLGSDIKAIIETKNRLFKQYVALFHQLEHFSNDERLKAALECLNIMDEVQRLWGVIDYHREHGILPPTQISNTPKESNINAMDKAQLIQYRNNSLRPALSQLRRKLKLTIKAAKRDDLKDQIDRKELLLREVEIKIQMV